MDHVAAFKCLHRNKDICTDSSQHSNNINSQLNEYKTINPIPTQDRANIE